MSSTTEHASFESGWAGGRFSVGAGRAGDAPEQIGPMLRSVLRLLDEIGPEDLMSLPIPPLPVGFRRLQDGRIYLGVLVTLAGEGSGQREETLGSLLSRGLRVTTVAGDTVAGNVELANVSSLAAAAGRDAFIEAAAAVRGELDASVPEAWNGGLGAPGISATGHGVVVGIVDSGVDVSHPSLRTASGNTRICAIWDQTLHGFSAPPIPYGYGSEWDAAAIDAYLLAASPMVFPSTDATGHGTAVAGIAVSNGRAVPTGRYVGIAPDADMVVVVLESRAGAYASSDNVIDAVEYVLETAAKRGQRAVVNLSQGAQIGPHDPAGQFERAVTALLAADSQRVVVKSIGNTGEADAHAKVVVSTGGTADLKIHVPRLAGPFVIVDLWYELGDTIAIELMDPAGRPGGKVLGSQHRVGIVGNDAWEIDGLPNALGMHANQMQVKIHPVTYTGDVSPGSWRLRIHGAFMGAGRPVHAWLERSASSGSARFLAPFNDPDFTLTAPASADEVFTVGSYALMPAVGPLSNFSSRGPARSGSVPGLICAPGQPVTTLAPSTTHAVAHSSKQGTSFAAPHVTGAIALMLEANNALTRSQLHDCLLKNARIDADTSSGPPEAWGSGKLDIAAALQCGAVPGAGGFNTMPIDVEITSTPGLIDPDTGQPTVGQPYEDALSDFLSSNGVANTDIEMATREALRSAGESIDEAFGWWNAIHHFFASEIHEVVGVEESRVELAGYWLTLPDVPQAKVTLTVSVTDKKQRAMSVKIAGVGGGPSFELAVESGLQHEATNQQRAVLATRGTFQRVEVTKEGKVIGKYARLVALDEENVQWSYPAAALPDLAQLGTKGPTTEYDTTTNPSADKITTSITQGTTWSFSAGIKLAQLGGIEAGINGQVSYQREVCYEYLLPPGRHYKATTYANFPVYVWATE